MPVCGPLVGVGRLQHQPLRPGAGNELQTDGQAFGGKAAGQGDSRQTGQVEGGGEAGQARCLGDRVWSLDGRRGNRRGGGEQQVVPLEE